MYWSYDSASHTLTIFGTGAMENFYSRNPQPWFDYKEEITTVDIREGVTNIGEIAFQGCTSLTSITIPEGVTTIGLNAFENCSGLTSITIPASVTTIGIFAFQCCSALTTVIMQSMTPPTLGYYTFAECDDELIIYVPTGTAETYKEAPDWQEYEAKIKEINEISTIALADNADNSTTISNSDGETAIVTLQGHTLYMDGDWNTLCLPFDATKAGTLAGATIKEIDTETAYNGHKTGIENGTLYLNFRDAESIVAGRPYIVKWDVDADDDLFISSTADWNTFASNVNNGTESYKGKLVKLAADISVSTMVGTANHPFSGTFDGAGHTLNVSITDKNNQGTAPFRYISGATIRNLKVTGTVTGNLHCAGLVGFARGTNVIRQCEVAVTVTCGGGVHSHCGGIVGHGLSSVTTITNCLFSGTISGATTATGIIYGWGDGESTPAIVNSLANSTYTDCNGIDLLKKSQGTGGITNCYKTQNIGSQGTYTTATGSDLVALLGDGWQVSGGNVVPKMNASIISIVNPAFADVTIDASAPTAVTSDDGKVSFTGSYSPVDIAGEDRSILFLGGGNTLYWPNAAMTINAFRAYFKLNGLTLGDPTNGVRAFVLNFDDGNGSAGVSPAIIADGDVRAPRGWYTLNGHKLDGKPTKAGLYINNGRKIVIK